MILQSAPVSPATDAVHRSSRFFGGSRMIEGSMALLRMSGEQWIRQADPTSVAPLETPDYLGEKR